MYTRFFLQFSVSLLLTNSQKASTTSTTDVNIHSFRTCRCRALLSGFVHVTYKTMAVPTVVVVLFATLPPYYSIWIKRKDVGHSAGVGRFSTVGGAVQYSRGGSNEDG